jgi:hypothetical protein
MHVPWWPPHQCLAASAKHTAQSPIKPSSPLVCLVLACYNIVVAPKIKELRVDYRIYHLDGTPAVDDFVLMYRSRPLADLLLDLAVETDRLAAVAVQLEADEERPASSRWLFDASFLGTRIAAMQTVADDLRRQIPWDGPDEGEEPEVLRDRYLRLRERLSLDLALGRWPGGYPNPLRPEDLLPCPFPGHEGDPPSLVVDPESGRFACVRCGRAGTPFTLVRDLLGHDGNAATLAFLEHNLSENSNWADSDD